MSAGKTDWTPLGHAGLALVCQAIVAGVALLFGLGITLAASIGAVAAVFWYYGREVAQFQASEARRRALSVVSIWWVGFAPWLWGRPSQLDLIAPAIATVAAALLTLLL